MLGSPQINTSFSPCKKCWKLVVFNSKKKKKSLRLEAGVRWASPIAQEEYWRRHYWWLLMLKDVSSNQSGISGLVTTCDGDGGVQKFSFRIGKASLADPTKKKKTGFRTKCHLVICESNCMLISLTFHSHCLRDQREQNVCVACVCVCECEMLTLWVIPYICIHTRHQIFFFSFQLLF